jgi:hypothetical protein
MEDVVAIADEAAPEPTKRGPDKKRVLNPAGEAL